jgi:hypothetical protein
MNNLILIGNSMLIIFSILWVISMYYSPYIPVALFIGGFCGIPIGTGFVLTYIGVKEDFMNMC